MNENTDAVIEERIEYITQNDPWIGMSYWTLTGFLYVPEGTKKCDRCNNEKLVRLYEVTNEEGVKIEVGSTCITRIPLIRGQEAEINALIRKARRELAKQHKIYNSPEAKAQRAAERKRLFSGWKRSRPVGAVWDEWEASCGTNQIKISKDGPRGWVAWGSGLTWFKSSAEAKQAVEKLWFGEAA